MVWIKPILIFWTCFTLILWTENAKKCCMMLNSNRMKKITFLYHYSQAGGARNRLNDLPVNVLRRGQIVYYSVNFDQHRNYYKFFSTDMIDTFLDAVYDTFKPERNLLYKFQG